MVRRWRELDDPGGPLRPTKRTGDHSDPLNAEDHNQYQPKLVGSLGAN